MFRSLNSKSNHFALCLSLVACAPVCSLSPLLASVAIADDGNSSVSGNNATAAGATLQGGVATTVANAEATLTELEQTVKHVRQSAEDAFYEAQRPDMLYAGGPNVVGSVVINPVGIGGYLPTGGYLPVRKKWIDYFSMHVAYLAPILKQELESFVLPPGVSSDTTTDYEEYKKIGSRLPDMCEKMIASCQGPKYDNMTIGMAAGTLNEELKRFDKQRKELLKDIREDYKHLEKERAGDKK